MTLRLDGCAFTDGNQSHSHSRGWVLHVARILGLVSLSALALGCSDDSDDAADDEVGMQSDDATDDNADDDSAADDEAEPSGVDTDESTSDDSDGEDTSDESTDDGASDDTDEEPVTSPTTPSEIPEFDASLDSDTKLVDLSSAQLEELCLETEEFVNGDALVVAQCEMFGALFAAVSATSDAEYQAACVQLRDECLAEPAAPEEQDFQCEEDPNFVAECTATVGDYEECMSSIFASAFVTCDTPYEEAVRVLESSDPEGPMIDTAACDRIDACDADVAEETAE